MQTGTGVGFYGKLPVLGDFIGRRVPDKLLQTWDAWMQASLAHSRSGGGEGWLDVYLTGPMWRFCAHPGTLDTNAVAGVVFPSVDRVGRCFPFTVFAQLPASADSLVVAASCSDWFERVEDLVLAQFEDSSLDLDGLDAALQALTPRLQAGLAAHDSSSWAFPTGLVDGQAPLHLPLGDRADITGAALGWLSAMIRARESNQIHWWSSGSVHVRPSWLLTRGLPEPAAYAAMLTGAWRQWPWTSCDTSVAAVAATPATPSLHVESAGTTHPGKLRSENQDTWMGRPELGVWAVADGMGGHDRGSLASQLTRDALNNVAPTAGLAPLLQSVRAALADVNDYLYSMSLRPVNPVTSGSTVVALMIHGVSGACVWAGDSRLYRLRAGRLEQLTQDHSGDEGEASNVITRAIGGNQYIDLDQVSFGVQVGDRFLLCSDGLYRETPDTDLARLLASGDALSAVDAL
ncbi:MAG: type VI secretion system-associated protein TagF, partial [Steroidobacteraceae bacterium]